MSRRARNRPDKRATALDLARMFGHGTPMPGAEHDDEPDYDGEEPMEPDRRIPIGPLDVASNPCNSERHA
jgi:hypothetical protein